MIQKIDPLPLRLPIMLTRGNLQNRLPVAFFVIWLSLCVAVQTAFAVDKPAVRFSRDVLPVLSENCFFCHGPDEEKRSADLRLDTEAGVAHAIDRSALGNSELLRRIMSADPDEMMPPPDSNRRLSAEQKNTLKLWVKNGATWGKHWSFEPLESPAVPSTSFSEFAVHNPVDAFVQAKLAEKRLRPSQQAARHTLLRRVTLDLTGLPPTPQEARNFLADTSVDAYEKAVERLLASSAYGEGMAWNWLDAARYADTNGYQGDNERTMWPWRDWVVDAFNSNMPFDQFSTMQLAGDLLPNATFEEKLATGFCRNYMINGEGGRIPEENRVDYVMDMSETMGTVWLGLTLNCCRCHDHKYDPLTQNEYYQFFAFFNQTPVTGGGGDPQTAPNLEVQTAYVKQQLEGIQKRIATADQSIAERKLHLLPQLPDWEKQQLADENGSGWKILSPQKMNAAHQSLKVLGDQSILVEGNNAANDTYTMEYSLPVGPLAAVRLDALRHESMTQNGLARSDSGNFVLSEIECRIRQGEKETSLKIASAEATFEQGDLRIGKAFDGNAGTGWAVYEGRPIDREHAAVFRFENVVDVAAGATLVVILRHDSPHQFHNLGRFRLSAGRTADAGLSGGNEALLADLKVIDQDRNPEQRQRIQEKFLANDQEFTGLQQTRSELVKQRDGIKKSAPKVMVMADQDKWRPTFVLNRGLYNDVTDREVSTMTPVSLPAVTSGSERNNRLDLARWLMSDDHPLTARVTVNRFWQQFFGTGLVKTTEDFGVQAEYPEQKDLLDWLAADFRDNGWDVKRLVRTIVTSHTYRQSSGIHQSGVAGENGESLNLFEVDPGNRLLARASRFRMPAWMLRDQALAVSGLLNDQVGGPPINTYQPPGVWEEATFGNKKYFQDSGEKLYRRSLYIFWRRIIAPTMFFDNASRQSCTVKPSQTNTPLHALLTFNETQYVEAARTLAERLLLDVALTTDEVRMADAFLRILSRPPSQPELQVMLNGVQRSTAEYGLDAAAAVELLSVGDSLRNETLDPAKHAAWASACLTLMNTDEALNRE